ncbi:MAG: Rpn family recombination-promoting nuclease/putative transposase [Candidatus Paracaedibacteraceae bacterium]|nr:Rpn family recombination-promoting nuclease/putative transposase [Candidatus Paracaedibacteraceae bacterium]
MSRFYSATNDVAFKKLFTVPENKPLLLSFLNMALKREGDDVIVDVSILPNELLPNLPELKNSLVDFRCRDKKNFQYIVEVQNRYMTSFMQRIQYYTAKTYTAQLEKGDEYLELRPVVLLSILKQNVLPESVHYISCRHTLETGTNCNYLKDMSYVFIELAKFTKTENELETIEDHWIHLLKDATKDIEIPHKAPPEIVKAYHELEAFRWSVAERDAYDRAKIAEMDAKDSIRTAIEKGKTEGKAEGKAEERRQIAREMLADNESDDKVLKYSKLTMGELLQLKAEICHLDTI